MIHEAMDEYEKRDDGEERGDFLGFLRASQAKDPQRYTDRQIMGDLVVNM